MNPCAAAVHSRDEAVDTVRAAESVTGGMMRSFAIANAWIAVLLANPRIAGAQDWTGEMGLVKRPTREDAHPSENLAEMTSLYLHGERGASVLDPVLEMGWFVGRPEWRSDRGCL